MYPPGYHHNDFVATHSLRHMMYGYMLLVLMNQECSTSKTSRLINKARRERPHFFHNYICITPNLSRQTLSIMYVMNHKSWLILRPLLCLLSTAGSLVPATCNRTSCAQLLELLKSHCCDNWEDRLFPWLHIYYANLALSGFEQCVCRVSLMVTHFTLLVLLPAICNSTSSCAQVLWGTKMPLWW